MNSIMIPSQLWSRLPTLIRAPLVALTITMTGSILWGTLATINLQTTPTVLWAFPAMLGVLYLLWQYLGGRGWPASASDVRREYLRANAISREGWLGTVMAWLLGVVSLSGVCIALGVTDAIEFGAGMTHPATGNYLVTYTDGVNEAMNEDGAEYGYGRLEELLNQKFDSSTLVIEAILDDVDAFVQKAPQSDDLTVLVYRHL